MITHEISIVITGAMFSGKTKFVTMFGRDDEPDMRPLEQGVLTTNDIQLRLYTTPASRRFDLMWEIFTETQMIGFVVMVNSALPATFREAKSILETFKAYCPYPYVLAANHQDHPDAWSPDDLQIAMRIEDHIPVVPCIATDKEMVKNVLCEFLYEVLRWLNQDSSSGTDYLPIK